MYKVFVNEKKLLLSKYPADIEKNLRFEANKAFVSVPQRSGF